MSGWLKLAIPVGLGLAAMYLNYTAGTTRQEPSYFVQLGGDLKTGDKFTEDNMVMLVIRGASENLKAAAIPWKDRSVLLNRECSRDLKKGDIVFWRDATPPPEEITIGPGEVAFHLSLGQISSSLPSLLKVGDEIGFFLAPEKVAAPTDPKSPKPATKQPAEFEYIGPFRILSIGTKVSPEANPGAGSGSDNRELTLAVKLQGDSKKLEPKAARLVEALMATQRGEPGIVAAVLHSAKQLVPPTKDTGKK
jgi:hypothetical protein